MSPAVTDGEDAVAHARQGRGTILLVDFPGGLFKQFGPEYLLVLGPVLLPWEADRAFGGLLWFRAGVIAVRGHRLLGSFDHAGHVW